MFVPIFELELFFLGGGDRVLFCSPGWPSCNLCFLKAEITDVLENKQEVGRIPALSFMLQIFHVKKKLQSSYLGQATQV